MLFQNEVQFNKFSFAYQMHKSMKRNDRLFAKDQRRFRFANAGDCGNREEKQDLKECVLLQDKIELYFFYTF